MAKTPRLAMTAFLRLSHHNGRQHAHLPANTAPSPGQQRPQDQELHDRESDPWQDCPPTRRRDMTTDSIRPTCHRGPGPAKPTEARCSPDAQGALASHAHAKATSPRLKPRPATTFRPTTPRDSLGLPGRRSFSDRVKYVPKTAPTGASRQVRGVQAAVLKTAMGRESHRGFESHTLRTTPSANTSEKGI